MSSEMLSVVISQKVDGSWQAQHVPSGKVTHGESKEEAEQTMRDLLGMTEEGTFDEPKTSDRFEGIAKEMAEFLEGPISEMLAAHSGFARLEAFQEQTAHVRLGGGCQGCPASTMTLVNGVMHYLQEEFGEDIIKDIVPVQ